MKVTAVARRSEGWWAVEVPEVEGAFTQARRLDQVPHMVADAVSLLEDVPVESVEVTIRPVLAEEDESIVALAVERAREAARAVEESSRTTRTAVSRLKTHGLSVRDIGGLLGISPQRVSQLTGHSINKAA